MRVLEMSEKRSSHTLCDIFMKPPENQNCQSGVSAEWFMNVLIEGDNHSGTALLCGPGLFPTDYFSFIYLPSLI